MNKSLYGESGMVKIECMNAMFLGYMKIYRIMTYDQHVEGDNLR